MSAVAEKRHQRGRRYEIYKKVVEIIKNSGDEEVEINASKLADMFNIQSPTMDYHLKKLVEEGYLATTPRRGRYNRKYYRLPTKIMKPQDEESILDDLKKDKKKDKVQEQSKQSKPHQKKQPEAQQESKVDPDEPLKLDDKIQSFLEKANSIEESTALLKKEDREILSVINETIQQNLVYLNDLSEQLSTVENKELIQHLIDERNKQQKEIENLREENKQLRASLQSQSRKQSKSSIDPNRIRFMQQRLVHTLDSYVELPNHALALQRKEFRSNMMKEIRDLVHYVLKLEA